MILNQFKNNETKIIISDKKILGSINFDRFKYLSRLDCSKNKITSLNKLDKCNYLTNLDCSFNCIINLNNLPNSLTWLFCSSNPIVSLDNLPINLKYLVCSKCNISKLDNLPGGLKKLICSLNKLEHIGNLPLGIIELDVSYNKITCLDYLPSSIKKIDCSYNKIENFDNIPNCIEEINLQHQYIFINPITSKIYMDNLPKSMKKIYLNVGYSNYENVKEIIPIKNINLNNWKLKKSLIDGNYLQRDNIQDVITFSPSDYDEYLDIDCECFNYVPVTYNSLNYYRKLHRNSRCECYNIKCRICR